MGRRLGCWQSSWGAALRYQYRITKYDPALRSADGSFQGEEWTAYSDIGSVFNGALLSEDAYLQTESAYMFAVEALLREAGVASLVLRDLETRDTESLPQFVEPEARLGIDQCVAFTRIALRELAWGKLVEPGRAYVHFGWDYYMYMGLPARCAAATAEIERRGLFVEAFRSPYLRPRTKKVASGLPMSATDRQRVS
jgi:hypothetical protein